MANEENLRRKARACKLKHPEFGEMNFPSLNYAAGWLGCDYLKNHCDRHDVFISYGILAFLLDNKVVFNSRDTTHPLIGLEVFLNEFTTKKAKNEEIKEVKNEVIKEVKNEVIKEVSNEVIKEDELSCAREESVLNKRESVLNKRESGVSEETIDDFDQLWEKL